VTALEYATQKQAILIGKPASEFFTLACQKMGVPLAATVVIGDDLEAFLSASNKARSPESPAKPPRVSYRSPHSVPATQQKGVIGNIGAEATGLIAQ